MKPEAKFEWIGPRPVDDGKIEETVRADMRLGGVNMRKPRNLILSSVLLSDDPNGPVVNVWGGEKTFKAEYSAKAEWVTLDDIDGDAA